MAFEEMTEYGFCLLVHKNELVPEFPAGKNFIGKGFGIMGEFLGVKVIETGAELF